MSNYSVLTVDGGVMGSAMTYSQAREMAKRLAAEKGVAFEVAGPGRGEESGTGEWIDPPKPSN
jgi:hypothetical protein